MRSGWLPVPSIRGSEGDFLSRGTDAIYTTNKSPNQILKRFEAVYSVFSPAGLRKPDCPSLKIAVTRRLTRSSAIPDNPGCGRWPARRNEPPAM